MGLQAVKIDGYDDALQIIDQCSVSGQTHDDLYDAVRFIDKNAFKIYPNEAEKARLWETARGSWRLQLATGGGKYTTFKSIPSWLFTFAMIDEENFGNGVGLFSSDNIVLSLLGPHISNIKQRRMFITIDDMYVMGGNRVTSNLPDFIRDGMGIGKQPKDFRKPPAFTFIGASDKSLIARGGTGGIAIWTRLQDDIRPNAYDKN